MMPSTYELVAKLLNDPKYKDEAILVLEDEKRHSKLARNFLKEARNG